MKKEVSINGRLVFPLEEGCRAVILTDNKSTFIYGNGKNCG